MYINIRMQTSRTRNYNLLTLHQWECMYVPVYVPVYILSLVDFIQTVYTFYNGLSKFCVCHYRSWLLSSPFV
jgi:hypothetical protein